MADRAEVVGTIAVQVEADLKGFATKLRAKLNEAIKTASRDVNFQPIVKQAEQAGRQSGSHFGVTFDKQIGRHSRDFGRRGSAAGRLFGRNFSRNAVQESTTFLGRLKDLLVEGINAIPLAGAFKSVIGLLGNVKAGPAAAGVFLALAPAIAGAAFEAIALIGYLSQIVGLLGAIPAAAAVTAAALAPVVIGFMGMGKAISAVLSGDKTKIEKAFKNLAPAAREVAKEVGKIAPQFRELRKQVQQALFAPLQGDVTKLGNALSGPLTIGLSKVARTIGGGLDKAADALASSGAVAGIGKIFDATDRVLRTLGGPVGHLFRSFGNAIVAALPSVEKLAKIGGNILDTWAVKLQGWIDSGKFEGWIDTAIGVAGDLKDLIGEVYDVFVNIFRAADGDGKSTLEDITGLVHKLNNALKDPEVKKAIKGDIELFKFLSASVLGVVTTIGLIVLALGEVVSWAQTAYHWIRKVFGAKDEAEQKKPKLGDPNTIVNAFQPPPKFAEGGILREHGLFEGAEGNRPEAVVPMTNPTRAAEVLQQAGLADMFTTRPGGTNVTVYLGTREIEDIIKVVVVAAFNQQARTLSARPRGEN
jgi:hypothetical protein